jgi:hypothetical protein
MPSHEVHRRCAILLGIRGSVAEFVDDLIDFRCKKHDVGLEHIIPENRHGSPFGLPPQIVFASILGGEQPIRGVEALIQCLQDYGRLDDEHLKAVALHLLLDCFDRAISYLGTWKSSDKESLYSICCERIEKAIKGFLYPLYANLFTENREPSEYAIKILNHVYNFVNIHRSVLNKCVDLIKHEKVLKKVPEVNYGTFTDMLSDLCEKLNIKCLFYVDNSIKPLPVLAATKKVVSELRRGKGVTLISADGSIRVEARTLKEFTDKLMRLLEQHGLLD